MAEEESFEAARDDCVTFTEAHADQDDILKGPFQDDLKTETTATVFQSSSGRRSGNSHQDTSLQTGQEDRRPWKKKNQPSLSTTPNFSNLDPDIRPAAVTQEPDKEPDKADIPSLLNDGLDRSSNGCSVDFRQRARRRRHSSCSEEEEVRHPWRQPEGTARRRTHKANPIEQQDNLVEETTTLLDFEDAWETLQPNPDDVVTSATLEDDDDDEEDDGWWKRQQYDDTLETQHQQEKEWKMVQEIAQILHPASSSQQPRQDDEESSLLNEMMNAIHYQDDGLYDGSETESENERLSTRNQSPVTAVTTPRPSPPRRCGRDRTRRESPPMLRYSTAVSTSTSDSSQDDNDDDATGDVHSGSLISDDFLLFGLLQEIMEDKNRQTRPRRFDREQRKEWLNMLDQIPTSTLLAQMKQDPPPSCEMPASTATTPAAPAPTAGTEDGSSLPFTTVASSAQTDTERDKLQQEERQLEQILKIATTLEENCGTASRLGVSGLDEHRLGNVEGEFKRQQELLEMATAIYYNGESETSSDRVASETSSNGNNSRSSPSSAEPTPSSLNPELEDCKPAAVSKEDTNTNENADDDSCPICLCEYEIGDVLIVSKHCTHIFHKECLAEWFGQSSLCPLCRVDMSELPGSGSHLGKCNIYRAGRIQIYKEQGIGKFASLPRNGTSRNLSQSAFLRQRRRPERMSTAQPSGLSYRRIAHRSTIHGNSSLQEPSTPRQRASRNFWRNRLEVALDPSLFGPSSLRDEHRLSQAAHGVEAHPFRPHYLHGPRTTRTTRQLDPYYRQEANAMFAESASLSDENDERSLLDDSPNSARSPQSRRNNGRTVGRLSSLGSLRRRTRAAFRKKRSQNHHDTTAMMAARSTGDSNLLLSDEELDLTSFSNDETELEHVPDEWHGWEATRVDPHV